MQIPHLPRVRMKGQEHLRCDLTEQNNLPTELPNLLARLHKVILRILLDGRCCIRCGPRTKQAHWIIGNEPVNQGIFIYGVP